MTNSIKYHIHINIMMMINIKLLSTIATTIVLTLVVGLGGTNNFAAAQVPALEDKPVVAPSTSTPEPVIKEDPPVKEDQKSTTAPNQSFGKITIPVSSGEQIILDVPMKSNNTYVLAPIK